MFLEALVVMESFLTRGAHHLQALNAGNSEHFTLCWNFKNTKTWIRHCLRENVAFSKIAKKHRYEKEKIT
jgi:hypothetical protein